MRAPHKAGAPIAPREVTPASDEAPAGRTAQGFRVRVGDEANSSSEPPSWPPLVVRRKQRAQRGDECAECGRTAPRQHGHELQGACVLFYEGRRINVVSSYSLCLACVGRAHRRGWAALPKSLVRLQSEPAQCLATYYAPAEGGEQ